MVPLHSAAMSQASTVPNVEVKDPAKRMDGADPLTKVESKVGWRAGSGSEDGFLQPVCAGIHQDSAFVVAHIHQGDRALVVQHAMPVPKATLHVRDRVRGHSSGLHHNSNIDSRVWLELLSQHILNLPLSPEIVKEKSITVKSTVSAENLPGCETIAGPRCDFMKTIDWVSQSSPPHSPSQPTHHVHRADDKGLGTSAPLLTCLVTMLYNCSGNDSTGQVENINEYVVPSFPGNHDEHRPQHHYHGGHAESDHDGHVRLDDTLGHLQPHSPAACTTAPLVPLVVSSGNFRITISAAHHNFSKGQVFKLNSKSGHEFSGGLTRSCVHDLHEVQHSRPGHEGVPSRGHLEPIQLDHLLQLSQISASLDWGVREHHRHRLILVQPHRAQPFQQEGPAGLTQHVLLHQDEPPSLDNDRVQHGHLQCFHPVRGQPHQPHQQPEQYTLHDLFHGQPQHHHDPIHPVHINCIVMASALHVHRHGQEQSWLHIHLSGLKPPASESHPPLSNSTQVQLSDPLTRHLSMIVSCKDGQPRVGHHLQPAEYLIKVQVKIYIAHDTAHLFPRPTYPSPLGYSSFMTMDNSGPMPPRISTQNLCSMPDRRSAISGHLRVLAQIWSSPCVLHTYRQEQDPHQCHSGRPLCQDASHGLHQGGHATGAIQLSRCPLAPLPHLPCGTRAPPWSRLWPTWSPLQHAHMITSLLSTVLHIQLVISVVVPLNNAPVITCVSINHHHVPAQHLQPVHHQHIINPLPSQLKGVGHDHGQDVSPEQAHHLQHQLPGAMGGQASFKTNLKHNHALIPLRMFMVTASPMWMPLHCPVGSKNYMSTFPCGTRSSASSSISQISHIPTFTRLQCLQLGTIAAYSKWLRKTPWLVVFN